MSLYGMHIRLMFTPGILLRGQTKALLMAPSNKLMSDTAVLSRIIFMRSPTEHS